MSTYAARSTRPPARTYLSQTRQVPLDELDGIRGVRAYRVESMPYPIHYAVLSQSHRDALWLVKFASIFPGSVHSFELYAHAQACARDLVGRRAAYDLLTFSGSQRLYMGTQRCPKKVSGGLCGAAAGIGTVWCDWHPGGKVKGVDGV